MTFRSCRLSVVRRATRPLLAVLVSIVSLAFPARAQQVAAAADLQFALPEILAAHVARGGTMPRVSYGSSGNFARQILQGAPFELFLSADESHTARVIEGGRAIGAGRHYATGRLALFLAQGSGINADRELADLGVALRDGRLRRLAIANPEHAPYGRAAREVLERQGLWAAARDRLALGDNAAQAAQFVASGAAQAGLIPLSLARAPELASKGAYATIPEAWHTPLRQTALLISGAGDQARGLADFIGSAEARAIFARHGFGLPAAR